MSATVVIDPTQLRSLVKDAVIEAMREEFESIREKAADEHEDAALTRAILEADPNDCVSQEEIMSLLESKS